MNIDSISDHCLAELNDLLEDMNQADSKYSPTQFWKNASQAIVQEVRSSGFRDFKSHHSALMNFVPSYAKSRERPSRLLEAMREMHLFPDGKMVKRLSDYLGGRQQALADYRVACAASPMRSTFFEIGESAIGEGRLHNINGVDFSKASLNYLRGLAFLQQSPGYSQDSTKSFLEIGGGFGSLGEIALKNGDENRYLNIDIPPVLPFSTYYLKSVFGPHVIQSYANTRQFKKIEIAECFSQFKGATLPAWQLPLLRGTVDCFVNFVSFQEMEPDIVHNYINLVSPLTRKYVLLRNSRHGKRIATSTQQVGVQKKTSLDMMINWFADFELVNRDSFVFGDESRFGSFKSEVAVLKRKKRLPK